MKPKQTKKQKALNKKARHIKTKVYALKQARKEMKQKDKEWVETVKTRDNGHCVLCSETVRLNAHHIVPKQDKRLRHELFNGISLCPNNHRFSFEMSAHQNPFKFFLWFMKNRPEQFQTLAGYFK